MDTSIVQQNARAALDGTKAFPAIVADLMAAGVEYYHVDYVARRKTFYSADGRSLAATIDYDGLPPVAADFDLAEIKAAILDSQRHSQTYRDFTRRVMAAGVQGYTAYLRGQRVTYQGRQGDQHTEWFPGAQPAKPAPRESDRSAEWRLYFTGMASGWPASRK
ncbi:MAG: DUF1398 family protein [Verrucomicrobia bacterium]|nr:DUF1398 family protein [Verrucomicrobiota bacterium]